MGNTSKDIGIRVRIARKDRSLSQEDLGLLIGLSRTSIVNIENGNRYVRIELSNVGCLLQRCGTADG